MHIYVSSSQETINKTDTLKSYGVFANFLINTHLASFSSFKGIETCCPIFDAGTGTGFSMGLFSEMPLPYNLRAGVSVGFSTLGGTLEKEEPVNVIINDELSEGRFKHILNASISEIGFRPYISYNVFKSFYLDGGGHIGAILSKNYNYIEKITLPETTGVFMDTKTRERNISEGDIEESSAVYGGIFVGAHYELPLNKTGSLKLSPEINFTAGMTNIAKDTPWKISSLKLGIAFEYTPIPEYKEPERVFERIDLIDTITISQPLALNDRVSEGLPKINKIEELIGDTLFLTETYKRTDTLFTLAPPKINIQLQPDIIDIKVQFVSEAFPVLPMIFFSENGDSISNSYNLLDKVSAFDITELKTDPIVFHENILNIIATRLKETENAKITLTGNADSTTEAGSCDLASRRANSVKDYLTNVWGIKDSKIKIKPTGKLCYPLNPTVTPNDSGFAENRRVNIECNDPKILQPILRRRFLEVSNLSSDSILISVNADSPKGITKWEIKASHGDKLIWNNSGKIYHERIILPISKDDALLLDSRKPLLIELFAEDIKGRTSYSSQTIEIKKDTNEYEIERMSLVLFDVGSDVITNESKAALKTFIRGLDEFSIVRVTGYTDALGFESNNLELSANRAKNTASVIREIDPNAKIIDLTGMGSKKMPNGIESYSTPAERFLSRTVQIENLKKIK